MNYFIAAILLFNFKAGTGWWVLFVVLAMMDILGITYKVYKEKTTPPVEQPNLRDIVKLDGTPYTYEDLQNIWNNGYQNGYINAGMKKQ
jgi:hypothetical protein